MPHYIGAIIDKSVLQSLSAREAKWLFHHFRVTIPPVLFSEVLGDLAKTKGLATGSGGGGRRHCEALTDACYVMFTSAVAARRRLPAASWSGVWYLLSPPSA